jgi:DNA-directed RNA polymerase subunit RPC12/RpoP
MGEEPMPVFVFGCLSCGKTVAGNEPRCPRCGVSFEGVQFECPFCGELVSPTQHKCGKCGTEFGAFAEEVSETSAVTLDGVDGSAVGEQTPVPDQKPEESGEALEFECPACGKSVSENDSKCPHCGALFQ